MTSRSDDPSVGQLVASIKDDLTGLVRGEIELAKAEMRESGQRAAQGGALLGVAAYLVVVATILLSIAAGYGLVAAGLGPARAFLIVGGCYLVLAAILGLVARGRFARVSGPERAKLAAERATEALRPGSRS
jgi:uncharacterized membrane protein YqjE